MRHSSFLAALLFPAAALAQTPSLRVLRHTPGDSASSGHVVTVTFDRPVAGRLGNTQDPRTIVRIAPEIAGRFEWRDPITLRFTPDAPFAPGDRFSVWIDTTFTALDGSRLAAPYRFTFRVPSARLIARSFGGQSGVSDLPWDGSVELLYTASVDSAFLARGIRLDLDACGGDAAHSVQYRALGQRPLGPNDPYPFTYARGEEDDTTADRFRRVVELAPTQSLPHDCRGTLVIPSTKEDTIHGSAERFFVRTAASFRLKRFDCRLDSDPSVYCPAFQLYVEFTAPVERDSVLKYVHLDPESAVDRAKLPERAAAFKIADRLTPRTVYTLRIDSRLRDVHGRSLVGDTSRTLVIGDYAPSIEHALGVLLLPAGQPVMPVRHVNVRRLRIIARVIPDSARAMVTATPPVLRDIRARRLVAETTFVSLPGGLNEDLTTIVPLPAHAFTGGALVDLAMEAAGNVEMQAPERPGLTLLPFAPRSIPFLSPVTLVQRTDLSADAHLGSLDGFVRVVHTSDGHAAPGALVRLRAVDGPVLGEARTNERGVAHVSFSRPLTDADEPYASAPIFGSLEVVADSDRVITPLIRRAIGYRPVNPLELGDIGARWDQPRLFHAAVYADRDIYRPGETLHLRGIVRRGPLGELALPARGDSVRLTVRYHPLQWDTDDDVVVHDTLLALGRFGTVTDSFLTRGGMRLGDYVAELWIGHRGDLAGQKPVAEQKLRIAEYRAPEFLVDLAMDSTPRYAGDTILVHASAHYLFGAPMRGALVTWRAAFTEMPPAMLKIPGSDGWSIGAWDWWSNSREDRSGERELSGTDSLDARGILDIRIPVAALTTSRPGTVSIDLAATDVNRQVVSAAARGQIHPSHLYVLARERARRWLWRAGARVTVDVRSTRADGTPVADVPIAVSLLRLQWTYTASARWRVDTVATDTVRSALEPVSFSFVPTTGALYVVRFEARDGRGGIARTDVSGWVMGGNWGEPSRNQYRLPLIVAKDELSVGDTTRVAFESPYDSAEAWVTVEREQVLEQRTVRVTRGANVVPIRIDARHVPNVFVSVALRPLGRHHAAFPDSARDLLRVGYAELRVRLDSRRLEVAISPRRAEAAPAEVAEFTVRVTDHESQGVRSEVGLWAVDEGVLALTGFETPKALSRIYAPRGVGTRFSSMVPAALTADPSQSSVWMEREAVYLESSVTAYSAAYSAAVVDAAKPQSFVRSLFRSTAFYLEAVTTDEHGFARVRARLPENLTTFRVMAVAADGGDRFGSGETTLVVTRPLVARAALPRFVRASDTLFAGAAVTARDGRDRPVAVVAQSGDGSHGNAQQKEVPLRHGSAEARFDFMVPDRDRAPDSLRLTLKATDGTSSDGVRVALPVQPDFHVRAHTALGLLRDQSDVVLTLPAGIDPAKSRAVLRVGTTPLAPMLAAYRWLDAYPYYCTEQIASAARAMLAVWRATGAGPSSAIRDPRRRLQDLADELGRRQNPDGSIALWPGHRWSSPWLTAYAGQFLLDARDAGIVVDSGVVRRIGDYLQHSLEATPDTGGMNRFDRAARRLRLGDAVASVEFLRRAGTPDEDVEDQLLALAPRMTWEDRLRLAAALAPREKVRSDVVGIVDDAWKAITRAGNRVDLPDSAHAERAFPSRLGPALSLLRASLRLRPDHPWLGGLVETVLQQGRAERGWAWSTQDYASVVLALAALPHTAAERTLTVKGGGRTLFSHNVAETDSVMLPSLDGMLERAGDGTSRLRLRLAALGGGSMFYAVTVHEVPAKAPITPDVQGIVVERWYERFDDGRPVTEVKEGELVRVRLRVTVPANRQFVAVEDPLPAGLEPVDLSLRAVGSVAPFVTPESEAAEREGDRDRDGPAWQSWLYGSWDDGWWSPWEHKEIHDDRVQYFARMLWRGSYTASYIARATTSGSFVRPPAYAEEMYNPALQGRSDGGRFEVSRRP